MVLLFTLVLLSGCSSSSGAPGAMKPQPSEFGFDYATYALRVPGAAYQTTDSATGQNKLVTSSGVQTKGTISIHPDGTYVWDSAWDGKVIKGQWVKTGGEYPITLKAAQEGKDWKVGKGKDSALIVWDGNYMHYAGDIKR